MTPIKERGQAAAAATKTDDVGLVKMSFLSADELRAAHFEPIEDVSAETRRSLESAGPGARLCVLPRGPQTIPYLVS